MQDIHLEKEIKVQRYIIRRNCRSISDSFENLKLNYYINTFKDRSVIRKIRLAVFKLKAFTESQTEKRIKTITDDKKIKQFQKKIILRKLKIYFDYFNQTNQATFLTAHMFRQLQLVKKFFTFLKAYTKESIAKDTILVSRFGSHFLKHKFMSLIKRFVSIKQRENYILQYIQGMYIRRSWKIKQTVFNDWVRFYICERYREMKWLKRKIRIFLALKILTFNK
jgi:hypothetical protein